MMNNKMAKNINWLTINVDYIYSMKIVKRNLRINTIKVIYIILKVINVNMINLSSNGPNDLISSIQNTTNNFDVICLL